MSRQPTYLRVADKLESEIARRAPGSPVASEHELARRYDVSRLTARAALEELSRRFLVHRAPGRGTFVATRYEYPIGPDHAPSWTRKVRAAGGVPATRTETLKLAPATESIAERLAISPGTRAYFLTRVRSVDGQVAAYAQTWLRADLVPDLEMKLGSSDSLHALLERTYKLRPFAGPQSAEFAVAPPVVSAKLGRDDRPIVFTLRGITCSRKTGAPIESTESWLRADLFRVVFKMGAA